MLRPPPPNPAIEDLARGVGLEDARDLVRLFLDGFEETMAQLSAKKREERHRAAHSLKSSARLVGLLALSRQMTALEDRLSQTTGDVEPADLHAARAEFAAAEPVLRAFAAPPGAD
jgi:HPt (histidine-containing phosphotransfer) domain-containing protein